MPYNIFLFIQCFPLSPIKMYPKKKRRKKRPIFGETSLCRGYFIIKRIKVILISVIFFTRLGDEIKILINHIDKKVFTENKESSN